MRFVISLLTIALLAGSRLPLLAQEEPTDALDAVVHSSVITSYQVEMTGSELADQIARQYANQPAVRDKKLADLRTESLEQLVQRQIILHEFETAGYSVPESVIDEIVQERLRDAPYFGDRVKLIQTLQSEGMTFEQWRKQIRDRFIVEQMRLKNVSDVTLISPHKIEVYYLDHTNDYQVDEQVKLRMIVLNKPAQGDPEQTRRLANEILGQINSGASFADMATTYSQGSQQREGGEWGWVEKSMLRKELTDVAFTLKPGEKSGVIDTPEACYLMLVEDKRPAHIKPLADVRNEIENTLLAQERDRLLTQWIDRLKRKTFVRYF